MGNSAKEKNGRHINALNNAYRNHKLAIFYGQDYLSRWDCQTGKD